MQTKLSKKILTNILAGSFLFFSFFFFTNYAHADVLSPGDISTCGELASPGTYTLTADIDESMASPCFTITSDSVVIDPNGHSITGKIEIDSDIGITWSGNDNGWSGSRMWVFNGNTNTGTITGSAVFNSGTPTGNYGTINGNVIFNSGDNIGTINGDVTFGGGNNFGTVNGISTFSSNSYNQGTTANAIFNDDSYNAGGVTSLLLHFDGENNSQAFIDSSVNNSTIGYYGNPTISTTNPKFGQTSGKFNNDGGFLTVPFSANSITGDFTVDTWVYIHSVDNGAVVILDGRSNPGSFENFAFDINNQLYGEYRLDAVFNGGRLTSSNPISFDVWHHVAMTRSSGLISLFIDGVKDSSTLLNNDAIPLADRLYVGYATDGSYPFDGYIDELRILNGRALWTSDFTPPTEPSVVTSPGTVTGQATFNGSSYNQGVINSGGQANFYGNSYNASGGQVDHAYFFDNSFNNGTVSYGFFNDYSVNASSGNVLSGGIFYDVSVDNQPAPEGNSSYYCFSTKLGVVTGDGASCTPRYWYSSGDTGWDTLSSWWDTSSHDVTNILPKFYNIAVLLGSVPPIIDLDTWGGIANIDSTGLTGSLSVISNLAKSFVIGGSFGSSNSYSSNGYSSNGYSSNNYSSNGYSSNGYSSNSYNLPIMPYSGAVDFFGNANNATEITGDVTFNDQTTNSSTIHGTAIFNGSSTDSGTIDGNAIFTASTFNNGGPLYSGSSVSGSVSFSSETPVSFNIPSGGSWGLDTTNWIFSATSSVPTWTFINSINTSVLKGDAYFYDHGSNQGSINGDAYFHNFSYNIGPVSGVCNLYDSAYVVNPLSCAGGVVNHKPFYFTNASSTAWENVDNWFFAQSDGLGSAGQLPENGDTVYITATSSAPIATTTLAQIYIGTTTQLVTGSNFSVNLSGLTNYLSIVNIYNGWITGAVNGVLNFFNNLASGTVLSGATGAGNLNYNFYDTSHNTTTLNTTGDVNFYDTSYNNTNGNVSNATPVFNDSSYNLGTLLNAIFNDTSHNNGTTTNATFNDNSYNANRMAVYDYGVSTSSLLMHFDGANNSASFTDSSVNNANIGYSGNPKISTVNSKFGGASGYFDGNSRLIVPSSSDFNFGSGDFTIDGWFYFNNVPSGYQMLVDRRLITGSEGNSRGPWIFYIESNGTLNFGASSVPDGSSWDMYVNSNYVPPAQTWVHLAVVRSGSNIKLYANGTEVGSRSVTGAIFDSSNTVSIGKGQMGVPYFDTGFDGYMDELRIKKGQALWTSDFTPPTEASDIVPRTLLDGVVTSNATFNDSSYNASLVTGTSTFKDNSTNRGTTTNALFYNSSKNAYQEDLDSSTISLLHFNGDLTDSGHGGLSVTPSGTVNYNTSDSGKLGSGVWNSGTWPAAIPYLTLSGSSLAVGTGDFTIEFRYKPVGAVTSPSGYVFIDHSADGGGRGDGGVFSINSNGHLGVFSNGSWRTDSEGVVTPDVWNHIAFVRKDGVLYYYINGVKDSVTNSLDTNITQTTMRVGAAGDGLDVHHFNGLVDEFRYSNSARWTSSFTPPIAEYSGSSLPGTVTQIATFVGDLSENFYGAVSGIVEGLKVRLYNILNPQTNFVRNFVTDGPWKIVADNVFVNLLRNIVDYDASSTTATQFENINNGFILKKLSPGSINSCGILAEAGTYILSGNISNYSYSPCFLVTADSVVIDGNGKTITASSPDSSTYAVLATSTSVGGSGHNINIRNITIRNFEYSVNTSGENNEGGNAGSAGNITVASSTIGKLLANGGSVSSAGYSGGTAGTINIATSTTGSIIANGGNGGSNGGNGGVVNITNSLGTTTNATITANGGNSTSCGYGGDSGIVTLIDSSYGTITAEAGADATADQNHGGGCANPPTGHSGSQHGPSVTGTYTAPSSGSSDNGSSDPGSDTQNNTNTDFSKRISTASTRYTDNNLHGVSLDFNLPSQIKLKDIMTLGEGKGTFNFRDILKPFVFSPIPDSLGKAFTKSPKLKNLLTALGIGTEQSVAALSASPILVDPNTDGLFLVTNASSTKLKTFLGGDVKHKLVQLVKTYTNTNLYISLSSKDRSSGNWNGKTIVFSKKDKNTISTQIQTPSNPGTYYLSTPSSPLTLAIEVTEAPPPPKPLPAWSFWGWIKGVFN